MSTGAETLKAEIEAGTFSAYRSGVAPSVKIELMEDLTRVRPDKGITLRNVNEKNLQAVNDEFFGNDQFVDLKIAEPDSDERNNLIEDLKSVFHNSSYSITATITGHPDQYPLFITTMRIKLLN